MVLKSVGYMPSHSDLEMQESDAKVFFANVALFFVRFGQIIDCPEYFFCPLSFSYCTWPYVGGSGPLRLGHLLLGWNHGAMVDECLYCGSDLLIFRFGGSPLSGGNWSRGKCITCGAICKLEHQPPEIFRARMSFAAEVLRAFVDEVTEIEEYDGHQFSWGGTGLVPAKRTRQITRRLYEPRLLGDLISELGALDI